MNYGIHSNDFSNIYSTIKIAEKLHCNNIQTFLGDKIKTTIKYKYPLLKKEIINIKKILKEKKINLYIHSILTLNFCNNPDERRYAWGLDNLIYDMEIGNKLGAKAVVIHAGRYNTKRYTITPQECYKNYIKSLIYVLEKTKKIKIYIETPATKKNTIISSLQEFSELYHLIPEKYKNRIKICIDTCHIFVNNYNISTKDGAINYFKIFDELIGLKNVKLFHLNDSYGDLGSYLDRHAPLTNGFIFKKKKQENLYEILKISNKYKIPMILETNPETHHKNIDIMKKVKEEYGNINTNTNDININTNSNIDKKDLIIKIFEDLCNYHKTMNNSKESEFKVNSYEKALKELKKTSKIVSIKNIDHMNSIGKKSLDKIKVILQTNELPQHENIKKDLSKIKILRNFQSIYGVGQLASKKLYYDNGCKDIKDLKQKVKSKKVILTSAQKSGLKYYNNLKEKISYDEITNITNIVKKKIKDEKIKCVLLNAGSYAMKKSTSNDIDYIIIFKNKNYDYQEIKDTIQNILTKNNYVVDKLVDGIEKDIYLIRMNKKDKVRQMDIGFVEEKHKYFYILYFSSSRDFSKKIRLFASKKGYKLNEKGLYDKKSGKIIDFQPKSEKDIFDYLEFEYISPENR